MLLCICRIPRVRSEDKTIELWDSLGPISSNQHYLDTMHRYIYDEQHKAFKETGRDSRIGAKCGDYAVVPIILMRRAA